MKTVGLVRTTLHGIAQTIPVLEPPFPRIGSTIPFRMADHAVIRNRRSDSLFMLANSALRAFPSLIIAEAGRTGPTHKKLAVSAVCSQAG